MPLVLVPPINKLEVLEPLIVPVPEVDPPFNVAVHPAAMLSLPAFEKLSEVNKFSVPETNSSSPDTMCN